MLVHFYWENHAANTGKVCRFIRSLYGEDPSSPSKILEEPKVSDL